MKRKQVTNSDTSTRTINDCRTLGIHTYTYKHSNPMPENMRVIVEEDVVLSIDGKSAYKQRRICHRDANKIAFRTKYDGIPCVVVALAPPFGLHNSGTIWVEDFHAKAKVRDFLFFTICRRRYLETWHET